MSVEMNMRQDVEQKHAKHYLDLLLSGTAIEADIAQISEAIESVRNGKATYTLELAVLEDSLRQLKDSVLRT